MSRETFSGQDVITVLRQCGWTFVGRTGSHVRLRDQQDDDEVRLVSVPMHDEIAPETLRSIAGQCGVEDFDAFCEWIGAHR